MNRRPWPVLLLAAVLGLGPGTAAAQPLVAAAASLQFALEDLTEGFVAHGGAPLRFSYGASGNLARQIRQGAPFELFLSADERYVLELAADGLTRDRGTPYALGRLAILVPHGSPLRADGSLRDLAAALDDGRLQRFAIANPEHAPYGERAVEALRHAGLWPAIRPRLVIGENVSQAARFALSGSTQGGLVAQSLARLPRLAARGESAPVPADWHRPLQHRMVLLPRAGAGATRFHDYLLTPPARALWRRHGFEPPP